MKLYWKFIMGYLAAGVAGFIIIATLSTSLTNNYLIESGSKTLYDEATLIANTYSTVYEGEQMELSGITPQIKAVATFLNAQIWIVNSDGLIFVDSSDEKEGALIDGFNPAANGNKSYMVGNYFNTFSEDVLSVCAPITGNYKIYGYVVIHLPMSVVNENQYQILNIVYTTSLIVYLCGLILLLVLYLAVSRPLKKITDGARRYADGNLNYKIEDVNTHDEMGYLANTLNYMANELNEAEEYQHKFIANISHDFRSPLTSIKGYLEAILDGTIPAEKQNTYIERVIGETERLTKLTQSMLTVNTLDVQGKLTRENFDINRTVKETVLSFEGQCEEKGITFVLNFEDEQQIVYADYSKIQQVLYNLTDNAIKFSKKDGEITISTNLKREKVYVSVKDRGIGIAKSDVKKVFDRFYKSDASRGKDKKGTGLGLSIVKDIIQSHGENIDVISTEGVGTEFVFSLPTAQGDVEDEE